ncbi:MAG: magnesium/cobalt transporter CorA [bacterium]
MRKRLKKRSRKAGLPPGTLVHIGERRAETAKLTLFDFDPEQYQEKQIQTVGEALPFRDRPTVTWINVDGLHEVEVLKELGERFGLHPLVMEDILNTENRPKAEDYGEYVFLIVSELSYDAEAQQTHKEQISIVFGRHFVFSFQEKAGDVFEPIRERIRKCGGRVRAMGTDYLAYVLLDSIVDNYFTVLETLGEKIETLEEDLIRNPTEETAQTIHRLKREMIHLRRSVWPLREVISTLQRSESPLIQKETGLFLRDIYDHTIQVIDTVETFRDMLSGMLDIYLTGVSNRMNEVMKVLTIIATIFIPLTFIAGVYGMNFRSMPELEWRWGYPLVWLAMLSVGGLMLYYFRKRKWL